MWLYAHMLIAFKANSLRWKSSLDTFRGSTQGHGKSLSEFTHITKHSVEGQDCLEHGESVQITPTADFQIWNRPT